MTGDAVAAYLERSDPPARAACDLAVALAPAAFIEPALLRAVRLEALPHLGVEAEADLWFSPLVRDRTPDGISLDPEALGELRRRLVAWLGDAAWRERATRAAQVILGREASELRRVAEKVTWWSLSEGEGAEARIAQELAPVLAAVRSGRSGHARWAVRTLPGLPDAAHRSPAVWELAAHASSTVHRPLDLKPPGPALFETLGVEGLRFAELPLHRRGRSLQLGAIRAERALGILVPDTRPWYVEVRSDFASEIVTLLPGDARTVEVGDGDVRLRTLSGDVFRLSAQRPRVFISHVSQGLEAWPVLDAIGPALDAAGFEPWIDRGELSAGLRWPDEVDDALAGAAAGVLVLTPGGLDSESLLRGIDLLIARQRRDREFVVVPMLVGVDPMTVPARLDELELLLVADPESAARALVDRLAPLIRGTGARRPADPAAAQQLRGAGVMLGRAALREGLRRLMSAGGILVVNGPPGSGKSFSLELIRYVADLTGSFRVVSVDVRPLGAPMFTPEQLARVLAARMGMPLDSAPLPPDESEPPARYALRLAEWLLGEAATSGQQWWWVLDGFGADTLPVETLDLIFRLADGITTATGSPRLVLLDFPRPLPPHLDRLLVFREDIVPVGASEAAAFVETLGVARSPAERDAIAAAMLDGLPEGPARLAELSRRIEALTARGVRPPEPPPSRPEPESDRWNVDVVPIDWTREEPRQLQALLAATVDATTAVRMAENVGLPLGLVDTSPSAQILWRNLLKQAALAGLLRRLLEAIATDPAYAQIAPHLRAYL